MNGQKKKLLIIDDVDLCEGLQEIFTGEGYSVVIANDGIKAFDLIKKELFSVVLLDIKLPGLNDVEILRRLKDETQLKSKIIIISGDPYIIKKICEEKLNSFIAGVMRKPFDITELVEKISMLLNN